MTVPRLRADDVGNSAPMDEPARILTSLVGSYAQPDWLIDREKLRGALPAARARARALAGRSAAYLEEAQDDATLLAIRDQERAGLDIVTDGEMRRESYSNRFATALEGVDLDNPGSALDRSGHPNPVPRVVGPIARTHPVQVRDLEFLRAHTDRPIKITVPGPFTMSQQAQNDHYERRARAGARLRRRRATRRSRTCSPRAPTSSRSTSRTCRRGPSRRASTGSRRSTRALDGDRRHDRRAHLLRLRRDHPRAARAATRSCPSWPHRCDQISIETAQSGLDTAVLDDAARQDDHPRRARPRRPTRSRRRRRSPTRIRRALPSRRPASSSPRPTAA